MIQVKKKICKTCGDLMYIWAHGNCKVCDYKSDKNSLYNRAPIAKLSDKRKIQEAQYQKLRLEFLNVHQKCEIKANSNCTVFATECHHSKGRIGLLLTDVKYFIAGCRNCHQWAETHPNEAKEKGWSVTRLNK